MDHAVTLIAVSLCMAGLQWVLSCSYLVAPQSDSIQAWRVQLNGIANTLVSCGLGLGYFGLWMLASPEPVGNTIDGIAQKPGSLLVVLRWVIVTKAAIELVLIHFMGYPAGYGAQLLLTGLSMATVAGQYTILQSLGRRVGDQVLYRVTPYLMWSLLIGQLLIEVPSKLGRMIGHPIFESRESIALLSILYSLMCVGGVALILRYRQLIHAAAQLASQKYVSAGKIVNS